MRPHHPVFIKTHIWVNDYRTLITPFFIILGRKGDYCKGYAGDEDKNATPNSQIGTIMVTHMGAITPKSAKV